jgi:triosephosphate isomerase (TIM)
MKKPKLVVANFKMNLSTQFELGMWFANFSKAKKTLKLKETELVLCPPLLHLEAFKKKIKSKFVLFGAQDCAWEFKGSFTGENSPMLLKSLGVKYVILGHSERRKYLGETDQMIAAKVLAALKAGLTPVICIGENAQEKKSGALRDVVTRQLSQTLSQVSASRLENVVLCYEPVWAISANKPDHPPTSNEIMEARLLMKKILAQKYGLPAAEKARILYGGSVDGKNVSEVCVSAGMDGALVGGASLMPHDLVKIAQIVDEE